MAPRKHRVVGASLALVGVGNIGSHVIDQLARLPGLARVLIVDRDFYETDNLRSQNITARDVGRPKAVAQAQRLRKLNPALVVEAEVADIAALPPGRLQVDLILTALDSLAARLRVGETAWRLGVPLLDAGVAPAQQLVRVTGYRPARAAPCFACALDDDDYRDLAVVHPCDRASAAAPSTNGPSHLGALAAALLAGEAARFLRADETSALFGRERLYDAAHHRPFVTVLHRNLQCRFDHARWKLSPAPRLPARCTLEQLLTAARRAVQGSGRTAVLVEDQPLAVAWHCPCCGHSDSRVRVAGTRPRACPRCEASRLRTHGFALLASLDAHAPARVLRTSLHAAGIVAGDVVRVSDGRRVRRFVISEVAL